MNYSEEELRQMSEEKLSKLVEKTKLDLKISKLQSKSLQLEKEIKEGEA